MPRVPLLALGCAAALAPLALADDAPAIPALNAKTYARWLNYVRPSADELRWQRVPWRPTFWAAVTEAQAAEKPILLWVMNGHPLGCT